MIHWATRYRQGRHGVFSEEIGPWSASSPDYCTCGRGSFSYQCGLRRSPPYTTESISRAQLSQQTWRVSPWTVFFREDTKFLCMSVCFFFVHMFFFLLGDHCSGEMKGGQQKDSWRRYKMEPEEARGKEGKEEGQREIKSNVKQSKRRLDRPRSRGPGGLAGTTGQVLGTGSCRS